jgi:hypothetical protein
VEICRVQLYQYDWNLIFGFELEHADELDFRVTGYFRHVGDRLNREFHCLNLLGKVFSLFGVACVKQAVLICKHGWKKKELRIA